MVDIAEPIPSRSLMPILKGESLTHWGDDAVFSEQEETRVIRTQKWALFKRYDGPNNRGITPWWRAVVWEWTADKHTRLHNPRPSINPRGPLNGDHYVAKGGSYLCHESYCQRYRTSSRQALLSMTTADNIGFRVAGRHRVNTELS